VIPVTKFKFNVGKVSGDGPDALRSMLGVWKWGGEMCRKSRQAWLFRLHRGEPFLECFDLVRCQVAKRLGEEATVDLKRNSQFWATSSQAAAICKKIARSRSVLAVSAQPKCSSA
jgi:hypothetical protein